MSLELVRYTDSILLLSMRELLGKASRGAAQGEAAAVVARPRLAVALPDDLREICYLLIIIVLGAFC